MEFGANITWVGYVGTSVPAKYTKIFDIVAEARDTAFSLIVHRFKSGKELRGLKLMMQQEMLLQKTVTAIILFIGQGTQLQPTYTAAAPTWITLKLRTTGY